MSGNTRFTRHQHQFFEKYQQAIPTLGDLSKIQDEDKFEAEQGKAYEFVYGDPAVIKAKLNHTIDLLDELTEDNKIVAVYAYYLACLLENYYRARGDYLGIEDICGKNGKKAKLANYINHVRMAKEPRKPLLDSIISTIEDTLNELMTTPFHVSKSRMLIGIINLYRLSFVFSRLLVRETVLLTKDLQLIEKITKWLHMGTNVEKVVKILESPTVVTNPLSVGIFLVRGTSHVGSVAKHWAFASTQEKQIAALKRLFDEIYNRKLIFANDATWTIINLLTNFNWLFHISGPVAGWMTVGFLFFDVCVILLAWRDEYNQYLKKKSQYVDDIDHYTEQAKNAESDQARKYFESLRDFSLKQKDQLEIDWEAKNSAMLFMVVGATCLMLGFGASLLVQPGFAVVLCYFACVVGAAIYLSGDAYEAYCKAGYKLTDAKMGDNPEKVSELQREYYKACVNFYLTMAKNIIIPSLFIAAIAICWPAAVAMAGLYIGGQLGFAGAKYAKERWYDQEDDSAEAADGLLASPM